MEHPQKRRRPPFAEALAEWQRLLAGHGFPTRIEWILDENLVFEKDPAAPNGVRVGFQTRFTPRPDNLPEAAYDFFNETEARLVFYRAGDAGGKSVCLLLCDPVFEIRGKAEGFLRHDGWDISFCPGTEAVLEEITDENRWRNRLVKGRPLSDLDFCLPLALLREMEVHGRALTPYERFGVKILPAYERWRRSAEL